MNWISAVIVIVGLVFAFIGLSQGIIRMAFSAIGMILGIKIAGRFYGSLAGVISSEGSRWSEIVAFIIILIVILVIANIAGSIVKKLASILFIVWIDRGLGFVIGGIIGLMISAAVLIIMNKYLPGVADSTLNDSGVAKFVMTKFPLLLALLPEDFDYVNNIFS